MAAVLPERGDQNSGAFADLPAQLSSIEGSLGEKQIALMAIRHQRELGYDFCD